MDLRTPAQIEADKQWADLEARAKKLGFTTVDRSKGYATALYAVEQEERKRPKLEVVR